MADVVENTVIKCKKCGSDHHVKAGFRNEKQRYKCKDCNGLFVPTLSKQPKPETVKETGIKCKKCLSEHYVKAGFRKGEQRYRCKDCGCKFVPALVWRRRTENQKIVALFLYVSGLSLRRIAVVVETDLHAVYLWVRGYARTHYERPVPCGDAVEVELDEMWGYLQKKRTRLGCGRLIVVIPDSLLIGSVGDEILERLCVFTSV